MNRQKIKVYELRVKVFLLESIPFRELQNVLANFIDSALCQNQKLLAFHEEKCCKFYCIGTLWPLEKGGTYYKEQIYTLTVRTVVPELAKYFYDVLKDHHTKQIKGLITEIRIIPKKIINEIYSLNPVLIKTPEGYWRSYMSFEEYEKRLFANTVKKYNSFTGEHIQEDFPFYTRISFLNRHPIVCKYKDISLLGDKLKLQIADDERSQELGYFVLGTSLGMNSSRGNGFCNYRWI